MRGAPQGQGLLFFASAPDYVINFVEIKITETGSIENDKCEKMWTFHFPLKLRFLEYLFQFIYVMKLLHWMIYPFSTHNLVISFFFIGESHYHIYK